MKLVSPAGCLPSQRTQAIQCTTDALGSSNMMLSGLILVTRNRFVHAQALLAPTRLIIDFGVEKAVGVASTLARYLGCRQPTPASHQGRFRRYKQPLVGSRFVHPS